MAGPDAQRIVVDRALCIGTGNCVFYAERTFDIDGSNKATVVDPDGDAIVDQRMAVENCPTGALSFAREEPTA
jgi:ferredoxin